MKLSITELDITVTRRIIATFLVICAALSLTGCGDTKRSATPTPASASPTPSTSAMSAPVAAVNGTTITDIEIRDMMSRGMDRAAAVDQRITQTVMANAAATEFAGDATTVLNAARTDILAQLYVNRKAEALRKAVTEKEISSFYEKNLTQDEFRRFKLKFVIAKDAKDGQTIYETLTKNPGSSEGKAALERFQYLNKAGDNFQLAQEVPYGIGNVLKKMKAGDLIQPLLVREGILIVKIEEIKEGDRPELSKVSAEIRASLASQKLNEEVQQLRKAAKIELKG
jgi:parvulin-like peptidyl-prolyl isomerase